MTSYVSVNDSNATTATAAAAGTTNATGTATNVHATAATTATTRSAAASAGGGGGGDGAGGIAENVGTHHFHATPDYEDVPCKLVDAASLHALELDTPTSNTSINCCTDYDCDSYSDGCEKADTTPENTKKIDDIIEQQQRMQQQQYQQQQQYHHHHHHQHHNYRPQSPDHHQSAADAADVAMHYHNNQKSMTDATMTTTKERPGPGSDSGHYEAGLTVAVDDSNVKYCFAKPLCSGKDTLSKSERIESQRSNDTVDGVATGMDTGKGTIIGTAAGKGRGNTSDSSSGCVTPSTMPDNNSNDVGLAENSESLPHDDDDSSASNTTTTNKQSYAFTIDNFNDNGCDPETTKARYKSMMERFQTRHRRGASMSKLESDAAAEAAATMTTSVSATPLSTRHGRSSAAAGNANANSFDGGDDAPKVKMRVRDRSTSRVRDASKRHSWSPRSSTQESQLQHQQHQQQAQTPANSRGGVTSHKPLPPTRKNAGSAKTKPAPLQMPKGAANLMANRTQFTPRSTAMQLALQKVDFICSQPPLGELKSYNLDADNISETGTYTLDGDNYTEEQKDLMNIDKSLRQQQKLQRRPKDLNLSNSDMEPLLSNTKIPVHINNRSSNVLEVNYYHDSEDQQPQSPRAFKFGANATSTERDLILGTHETAGAYLEKIKSRVLRNATETKSTPPAVGDIGQKSSTDDDDVGCFTSVTTSGVLAKQGALDPRPKLTRKSSLSTSQIDSSEYVSNETKLKANTSSAYATGGFTDHQKAEYRLNLFTNQKDTTQKKFAATRSFIESPPETPVTKLSDTAVLKTAQTKNDWIQEWARNARARSLATETSKSRHHAEHQSELMTRSYTCASDSAVAVDSLTDDSIYSKQCAAAKLNRTLADRYRLSGECDYSSDPTLSSGSYSARHPGAPPEGICKPPKSPSKIPSPLHSLGRTRSASRSRPPLQNVLQQEEEDIYLQKTAAAINNLQQSLSRKNSLKSPTHSSASPRAHSARSHAHSSALYSPDGCGSPQHSLGSPTSLAAGAYHHSPLHRRVSNDPFGRTAQHLQLMTSSFNEQQLKLLTSGEYLAKQMRMRKNSFDGNIGNSPVRRAAAVAAANAAANAAAHAAAQSQSSRGSGEQGSPLRRSSSFSAKIATTQRAARPQFSNIYTPPAARHKYSLAGGGDGQSATSVLTAQANAIKKSASSNNFRHPNDYDENFQYYINDEDDMGDEYYSSGAEEVEEEDEENYYKGDEDMHGMTDSDAPSVPLSNTRYNKALLMRIERSKQKVSGGKVSSAPVSKVQGSAVASAGGVVACPNTPELPRRGIRSAPRPVGVTSARQSMPRDTSLSRLATQVPNSLASAKKQLLQTAAGVPSTTKPSNQPRVQPKYLDISKYKPAQGNNFLRKNESKSTLKTPADMMKRSPSSSSMGLSRADPTRTSNRSVRSVASCMTTSGTSLGGGGRASSAARRDASIAKQKEAEMAMWKRRSTYDPMKAAAEDRRKKDEAKRMALGKNMGDMPFESNNASRTPPPYKQQLSLDEQWTEYGEEECV